MTLAVVYGRNSSAKQKSIRDQITTSVAAVEERGWTLACDPLSDTTSASRYATKARANWAQLLSMLPAIDVVVVWEPSRGDRTLVSWVSFLDSCREHRVLIHAISHNRTADPRNARDYRSLAEDGIDSAYESDKISERVLRGHAASALAGRPHSRTTYGYKRLYNAETRAFDKQIIEPDQAVVVRQIIEQIGRGVPLTSIVQGLNEAGTPTHRGGALWYHGTVKSIATNVAYRPHPDDPKRGTRLHGDAEHPALWPPLVTRAAFEAAGRVLGTNSEHHRESRRVSPPGVIKYLLSGNASVATAVCGSSLSGFCDADGRGATYGCKMDRCASAPMPEADEYVSRIVVARLSRKDARKLWAPDNTASQAAADELAGLVAELEAARQSFATPGGISAATMAAKEAAMAPAIGDARRRMGPTVAPMGVLEVINAAQFGKDQARPAWDGLPLLARREIVIALFERLSLQPATDRLTRWSTPQERMDVVSRRIAVKWRAV